MIKSQNSKMNEARLTKEELIKIIGKAKKIFQFQINYMMKEVQFLKISTQDYKF